MRASVKVRRSPRLLVGGKFTPHCSFVCCALHQTHHQGGYPAGYGTSTSHHRCLFINSRRAVAALAAHQEILDRSGQILVAAQLAREYDFTDIDGTQPRPLTLADI